MFGRGARIEIAESIDDERHVTGAAGGLRQRASGKGGDEDGFAGHLFPLPTRFTCGERVRVRGGR